MIPRRNVAVTNAYPWSPSLRPMDAVECESPTTESKEKSAAPKQEQAIVGLAIRILVRLLSAWEEVDGVFKGLGA